MAEFTRLPALATIPAAGSVSNTLDLGTYRAFGLVLAAAPAWTAAALSFNVSNDNITFYPLYNDSGAAISIASADVVVGRAIVPIAIMAALAPFRYFQLVSGVPGTLVAQTNTIVISICAKE